MASLGAPHLRPTLPGSLQGLKEEVQVPVFHDQHLALSMALSHPGAPTQSTGRVRPGPRAQYSGEPAGRSWDVGLWPLCAGLQKGNSKGKPSSCARHLHLVSAGSKAP